MMGTDIHADTQKKTESGYKSVKSEWQQGRNYFLFAWLAGVRNGTGFAGTPTHTPIVPISEPRGLPPDIADRDIDLGDHSFSWLTSTEILSAKKPTGVTRTGIVTIEEYREWDGVSSPQGWCGGISGRDIVVSDPDSITEKTSHVQISWALNAANELDYFVDEIRRLHELHGEVRVVFGFDS